MVGGVNDTADQTMFSNIFANSSAMHNLLQILWLMNSGGGVNDTADQWWPRIAIDTADHMDPTCSRLLFSFLIKQSYIGKWYHTISTTFAKEI
jgi:hypothetical protein